MELEIIILHKINQSHKKGFHIFSHIFNLAKIKISIVKISPSEIFLESMLKALDNSRKFDLLQDD